MDDNQKRTLERVYAKAALQRWVLPGRVLFFMRCTYGTWTLNGVSLDSFIAALEKVSGNGFQQLPGDKIAPFFRVLPKEQNSSGQTIIKIDFVTPGAMFLDCCTLTVLSDKDNKLEMKFYNQSSGMCPMKVPFPTLIGCLLFWFPFGDKQGYSQKSMEWLKDAIDIELGTESSLKCHRYIPPYKERITPVKRA